MESSCIPKTNTILYVSYSSIEKKTQQLSLKPTLRTGLFSAFADSSLPYKCLGSAV